MNEINSIEILANTHLSDQTKFRLNEFNKIKDYFNSEIQERKIMSKKLSKHIAAFDYIDKTFICNMWGNKHHFFYKCYRSSCRNSKCIFYSCIFLTTGIIKRLLKIKL